MLNYKVIIITILIQLAIFLTSIKIFSNGLLTIIGVILLTPITIMYVYYLTSFLEYLQEERDK